MLQYTNTGQLKEWLEQSGYSRPNRPAFPVDEAEFNHHSAEIRIQHPELTIAQNHDRAALRCILLANAKPMAAAPSILSSSSMPTSAPITVNHEFDDTAILARLDAIIDELAKPQPDLPAPVVHVEPITVDGTPAQIHVSPPQVHVNIDTAAITSRLDGMVSAQYAYMKVLLTWLTIISIILVLLGLSAGNAFGQGITVVGGAATDGVAARGNAVVVAGLSGGIVQALSVDGSGSLNVNASVTATVGTAGLSISVAAGASTSGVTITPTGGAVHSSAPVYAAGTIQPFSFETDGDLRVAASVTPAENQNVNITRVGGATSLASGSGALVVTGANSDGTTATLMPLRIGGVDSAGRIQDALIGSDGALVVNSSGTAQPVTGTLTAVTTITNPVTVTDGAGSLNVIVDSGTITAVTSITNPVSVTGSTVNANFLTSNIATNISQFGGTTVTAAVTAGLVTAAPAVVETSAPSATAGTYRAASMTTAGAIRTDASATTQPISGTVTVGTFPDNEPFNLAQVGATAVVVGNTAGVQAVAPAVATTSAPVRTNNTLGMLSMDLAGALRTAVQSVAGTVTVAVSSAPGITIVSTPITSGISAAAGSSTSGININPAGGVVHSTAPVYSNGTFQPFSFETDGDLRVAASVTPPALQNVNLNVVGGATALASGSGALVVTGANSDGTAATLMPLRIGGVDSAGRIQDALIGSDGVLIVTNGTTATTVTGTLTAVTSITNPVTVTDGAGSLNVIVDSGTLTAVTSITNPVSVTGSTVNTNFLTANIATNVAQFGGTNVTVASTAGLVTAAPAVVETSAPAATAGTYRAASMTTAGAIRTDASATTQPVSGTVTVTDGAGSLNVIVDSGTLTTVSTVTTLTNFPDNEPFNVAQFGGSAVTAASTAGLVTTADAVATAANPVRTQNTYASLSQDLAGNLRTVVTDGSGALNTIVDSGTITTVSTVSAITGVTTITGAGTSVGTIRVVLSNPDPCVSGYTKGYLAISAAASAQLITGSTNNYIYICSLNIGPIGTATNVALVSGTGTVCATSIGGIFGGTTAATGFNIAANGGLTMGNGQGAIARTDTTGEHLCILLSAANTVTGHITYVLSP